MALLTVLQSRDGIKVTTAPAAANLEIAKSAISAVSGVSIFAADTSTSVNLANISDADFAKLYIGAPITGSGVAASSKIATLTPISGGNKATLNNATTTTVAGNSLTQTVSIVTATAAIPPQSMVVSETLAAIDAFTS